MKWNQIMGSVEPLDVAQAKSFMAEHPLSTFALLDVRQEAEYAEGHLPGARLMPIEQLMKGNFELDPELAYVVYCRSGNRSLAAAQWLMRKGMKKVYNLEGGLLAWEGKLALGEYHHNIHLLDPATDFEDALSMAYAMEEGLRQFYLQLGERVAEAESQRLLGQLAEFEEQHKASLAASSSDPAGPHRHALHGQILETGSRVDQLVEQVQYFINGPRDVFDLAMGIEAQAFDFYMRLSQSAEEEETSRLFLDLAEEEITHLDLLVKEADAFNAARRPY